jgi:hypothetical protein
LVFIQAGGLQGEASSCSGLTVALDAEAGEREILRRLHVGVMAEREVAGVDVHAPERVAVAAHRVEVVRQQLLTRGFGQPLPDAGRGFGEGAAEAEVRLVAVRRVDDDARQLPVLLASGLRQRLPGQAQAVSRAGHAAHRRQGVHASACRPAHLVQRIASTKIGLVMPELFGLPVKA